jgi:hypothetical protein
VHEAMRAVVMLVKEWRWRGCRGAEESEEGFLQNACMSGGIKLPDSLSFAEPMTRIAGLWGLGNGGAWDVEVGWAIKWTREWTVRGFYPKEKE